MKPLTRKDRNIQIVLHRLSGQPGRVVAENYQISKGRIYQIEYRTLRRLRRRAGIREPLAIGKDNETIRELIEQLPE
jgi:DNA-directed RNA polymerase sigma subunit (sigma70/sigma32)